MKDTHKICIMIESSADHVHEKAMALAERLALPLGAKTDREYRHHLVYTDNRLELQQNPLLSNDKHGPTYVDFLHYTNISKRILSAAIKDPLARAVGIKPGFRPYLVDATAGLGLDGITLAWLGCKVLLIERSGIIHALLEDGLQRACENNTLKSVIEKNVTLLYGNSADILSSLSTRPQTVLIDPMYPVSKRSALNKKEMRMLRDIVGDDIDAEDLFNTSLEIAQNRIVVKRPKDARVIVEPPQVSHSIAMKSGRFDVYMKNHL